MKSIITLAAILTMTTTAFASTKVEEIAKKLKAEDTRTVIKVVENTDGNPCMPEGKSYIVELQVKKAYYDRLNEKMIYQWETAKEIGVDLDGGVMEVCAE